MTWENIKVKDLFLREEKRLISSKTFGSVPINFVLAYPNKYSLGMSNLGFHSICSIINARDDALCHRTFFSLDGDNIFQGVLESDKPLIAYDILGFSVSFELDYIRIIQMLETAGIPIFAEDRVKPLVIVGGPVSIFNPEPLSPFVDVFVVGEGEEVIHEILDMYRSLWHSPKTEILRALSKVEGVYVPSLYNISYCENGSVSNFKAFDGAPKKIKKRWIKDLDKYHTETAILTSNTEFSEMFLLEISRGCGRNCRFCMAGYCYRIPRHRSLEGVLERALYGSGHKEKVGLVGASVSDYPHIDELSEKLMSRGVKFSVSSLRADTLRSPLMEGLAFSGHKTLTVAPEAGSARLRAIINKGITEGHIRNSVDLAKKHGIENLKLYYIVGFPFETDSDISEMISFLIDLRAYMRGIGSTGHLTISVNPFIPKPFTPFQWFGMAPMEEIKAKEKRLKSELSPIGIRVQFESSRMSQIQAALSRGDRYTGYLLYDIYKAGASALAYRRTEFSGNGISDYAHRIFDLKATLPWEHLDVGLSSDYFKKELTKSQKALPTRCCTDEICQKCRNCRLK